MPIPSCKSRSPRAPRNTRSPRSPLDTRSRSALLREFLLHLASERGLAENTLHAYRRDLELLEDHLQQRRRSFINADAEDYIAYIHGERRAR